MTNLLDRAASRTGYRGISLLTGLLLFCLQPIAWSANQGNPAVEKVLINADHMRFNIESGNSVYSGNVKISQGELVLTGDTVTLEQSDNEIQRIIVTGKPARYNHVTDTGETIKAESEQMVYTASQNKLVMTTNARLQQPDHQVSSQKITYDTLKRIIIAGDGDRPAGSDTTSDGPVANKEKPRVNITLTPKKQIQPDEEPAADESITEKTPRKE